MNDPEDHEFVYRLASEQEWFAAQESGVVPSRDIDRRDGYLHLSTRGQVLETAARHFADAADLLALEINAAPLRDLLIYELAPKRGEKFPHLYGALRAEHVTRALRLVRAGDGFDFVAPL